MSVTVESECPASGTPRLLISVRDALEAVAAMDGGADIIDIKEPDRGSLGQASAEVMEDIHQALRARKRFSGPISAALGELLDLPTSADRDVLIPALTWMKVGLSGCHRANWQPVWRQLQQQVRSRHSDCRLIAVVYADWTTCQAPAVDQIVDEMLASDSPGVLFDTFEKHGKSLFDYLPPKVLRLWIRELRARGRFVALAGSIDRQHLPELMALAPDIIAVRSAVCVGGRTGRVTNEQVAAFRAAMQKAKEARSASEGR